jgi:hypothetical protein
MEGKTWMVSLSTNMMRMQLNDPKEPVEMKAEPAKKGVPVKEEPKKEEPKKEEPKKE